MPLYEYRCPEGHASDRLRPFSVAEITCPCCGLSARRSEVNLIRHTGFVPTPTREHYYNLPRFIEAHGEVLHQAQKHNVELPDFLQISRDRIDSGAVKAIE